MPSDEYDYDDGAETPEEILAALEQRKIEWRERVWPEIKRNVAIKRRRAALGMGDGGAGVVDDVDELDDVADDVADPDDDGGDDRDVADFDAADDVAADPDDARLELRFDATAELRMVAPKGNDDDPTLPENGSGTLPRDGLQMEDDDGSTEVNSEGNGDAPA